MHTLKYLGIRVKSDEECSSDYMNRIYHAKIVLKQMRNNLCNASLSLNIEKRVIKRFIELVLLYGNVSWSINRSMQRSLAVIKMWSGYHRQLRSQTRNE